MKDQAKIVIYLSNPINPKIYGKIEKENIIIDKYDKLYYSLKKNTKGRADFIQFCNHLERDYKYKIIGIGDYVSGGKTTIYITERKNIINILSKEIQIIINELGLNTDNVAEISYVLVLEILKDIVIKNALDMNLLFQYSSRTFTNYFIIDEKIRRKIISEYQKSINKYISKLNCEKTILNKLKNIVTDNQELAISIISGIIVETCIRILVVLLDSPHQDMGEIKLTKKILPIKIYNYVISQKTFSIEEIKGTNFNELDLILLLNSLIELKILRKCNNIYCGTGIITLPNVVAKSNFSRNENNVISSSFKSYHENFNIAKDFVWKENKFLNNIIDDIFYYSSSKSE